VSAGAAAHDGRVAVARMFLRAGQPLGAAIVLTELVREHSVDPEVWCGLAAALLGVRRRRPRREVERWAALVLREATPRVGGSAFAATTAELRAQVAAPADDALLLAVELDQLADFLIGGEPALPLAIDGLPAADRLHAVTLLGEHGRHAAPVVAAAIDGRWGDAAARAGLAHAGRFLDHPAVKAAIAAARKRVRRP
jgi:hypothetical protein